MEKHPYINELVPEMYKDDIWPYNQEGYPDCEKYGFDDRETFSFDTFMIGWLYERLRYFQDIAAQYVNFDFHTFDIHDEVLTQAECIDRMCMLCKEYMYEPETKFDYDENGGVNVINQDELIASDLRKPEVARELFYILGEVFPAMWW